MYKVLTQTNQQHPQTSIIARSWSFLHMVVNNLFSNVVDNRFTYINTNNKLSSGDQIEACHFPGSMGNIHGLLPALDFQWQLLLHT